MFGNDYRALRDHRALANGLPPPKASAHVDNLKEHFNQILSAVPRSENYDVHLLLMSLQALIDRFYHHITHDERQEALRQLSNTPIPLDQWPMMIRWMKRSVFPQDDLYLLIHDSGIADLCLRRFLQNPTDHKMIELLSQISAVIPLLANQSLSDSFIAFIDHFLQNIPTGRSTDSHSTTMLFFHFFDIICNEFLSCAITGNCPTVYDYMSTQLDGFEKKLKRRRTVSKSVKTILGILFQFIKVSKKNATPIKRIEALLEVAKQSPNETHTLRIFNHAIRLLSTNPDLTPQILRLDIIARFRYGFPHGFEDCLLVFTTLRYSPPDLVLRAFTEHKPTLTNIFSQILFTCMDLNRWSWVLTLPQTNPALFELFFQTFAKKTPEMLIKYAFMTARVMSIECEQPRCLSFGMETQNWISIIDSMSKIDIPEQETKPPKIPASDKVEKSTLSVPWLSLLILCSLTTDDTLSNLAISIISAEHQLEPEFIRKLLFEISPIVNLPIDWALNHVESRPANPTSKVGSLGSFIGQEVLRTSNLRDVGLYLLGRTISPDVAYSLTGCLIQALASVAPPGTIPDSPYFQPIFGNFHVNLELGTEKPASEIFNTLKSFATKVVYKIPHKTTRVYKHSIEKKIISISRMTNCILLMPFLDLPTQERIMTLSPQFSSSEFPMTVNPRIALCQLILEFSTTRGYDTQLSLLQRVEAVIGRILFSESDDAPKHQFVDLLKRLLQRMRDDKRGVEGDEKWRHFAQLCAVSKDIPKETGEMILLAENDKQALFSLIASSPETKSFKSDEKGLPHEAFSKILEYANRTDDIELCAAAWKWIANETQNVIDLSAFSHLVGAVPPNESVVRLLLSVLTQMCDKIREGVEDGKITSATEQQAGVVASCLAILNFQLSRTTLSPNPFIPILGKLALIDDFAILKALLPLFTIITSKTESTPTPFTISTHTILFSPNSQTPPTQTKLVTALAENVFWSSFDFNTTDTFNALYVKESFPKKRTQRQLFSDMTSFFRNMSSPESILILKEIIHRAYLALLESPLYFTRHQVSRVTLPWVKAEPLVEQSVSNLWQTLWHFISGGIRHGISQDILFTFAESFVPLVKVTVKLSSQFEDGLFELFGALLAVRHVKTLTEDPFSTLLTCLSLFFMKEDECVALCLIELFSAMKSFQERNYTRPHSIPRVSDLRSCPPAEFALNRLREDGLEDWCEDGVSGEVYEDMDDEALRVLGLLGANYPRNMSIRQRAMWKIFRREEGYEVDDDELEEDLGDMDGIDDEHRFVLNMGILDDFEDYSDDDSDMDEREMFRRHLDQLMQFRQPPF
ncbi:hypothetical protein BLNAU_18370 [Blattamonas nauphoetae]|uniref:Uncharacterized protein n=1 Tax=Blattamonas nauphoetae TaxID=2049346 RepID=A0ABQ9X540_9EUKA|nr:hypothetical protein BLNAU_18370 [Blattamonas nauphoetae]